MNKKVFKILTIVLAALLVVGFVATTVHAADMVTPDGLQKQITYGESSGMQAMAGKIMGFIRNIAVIGGVIILMILGVKYMTGSLEEKADYKKSMIPLIVGILVVMAATTIMTFIINFFN